MLLFLHFIVHSFRLYDKSNKKTYPLCQFAIHNGDLTAFHGGGAFCSLF